MLKNIKIHLSFLLIFILTLSTVSYADSTNFDLDDLSKGLISIVQSFPEDSTIKIMISNGKNKISYDFSSDPIPLTLGNGLYSINILEKISKKTYKSIGYVQLKLDLDSDSIIYTQKTNTVSWDDDDAFIKKTLTLSKDLELKKEQAVELYDYIVTSYEYDFEKSKTIDADYTTDSEETFDEKKGICLDFSVLYASMLRSLDIPTKVVYGYNDDISTYHTWNEVYLSDQWVIVDLTYDIALYANDLDYTFEKDSSNYKISYTF